jgi:anti-anti-sigma regulatory factor
MGKKILIFDLGQLRSAQVFDWDALTGQLRRIRQQGGEIFIVNLNDDFERAYRRLSLDRVIRRVKSHKEVTELAEEIEPHDESGNS